MLWFFTNWKFFFALFAGNGPAEYRITLATGYLDPCSIALWPTIATGVYVGLAPVLRYYAGAWRDLYKDKEACDRIQAADDLLTREKEYNEKAASVRNDQLDRLRIEIKTSEQRISALKTEEANMNKAILDLTTMPGHPWEKFLSSPQVKMNPDTFRALADDVAEKFKRLDELRARLRAKYPDEKF